MKKLSEREREQEDRRLFRKHNICFRGPAHEWPAHHIRAFQHISVLGSQRLSTAYSQDSLQLLEAGEKFWKSSIKRRTRHLVEVTERNVGNSQSEMKWRLDLEKIVYVRFEEEIEWQVEDAELKCFLLSETLVPSLLVGVAGGDPKSK
jgi:hypothetical protein